ncbi:MAG: hypothetical protein KatS3mg120_2302 [Erythrobacter sp.]|nr:MAG: hypothetical protein KatS3mg120_2302 [Erythrobacter sp.]
MKSFLFVLLLQAAARELPLSGQCPAVDAIPAEAAPEAAPDTATEVLLPKATPVVIAVDKEVGSKISVAGEMFPIRLAQPVELDGVRLLPAGITGEGQVVHAKKAGMAGSAGELILAARYLDYNGRRIELRSFRFIEQGDAILSRGKNNVDLAAATNAAIGPLGFFISGGNTTIAPGTLASAKTRNDETFAVPAETAAAPDEVK